MVISWWFQNATVLDLDQLNEKEFQELFFLLKASTRVLKTSLHPHGFNIGINIGAVGGAGEKHVHLHIVPRWTGDTNFMPVLGETKIIPEYLENTYRNFTLPSQTFCQAGKGRKEKEKSEMGEDNFLDGGFYPCHPFFNTEQGRGDSPVRSLSHSKYRWEVPKIPLFLVILCSIFLGVLIGSIGDLYRHFQLKKTIRQNQKMIERLEREIQSLNVRGLEKTSFLKENF